jgi:spore maturation protein B
MQRLSIWSIPLIMLLIPLYGFIKRVKIYEVFTEGAAGGFTTVVKIIPYLLAMMVAINVFQASGAMDFFINLLNPLIKRLHIPQEVFPLVFLRPLSGSGSLSYVSKLLNQFGPDTFIGILASTIQGSTETTIYIITVYFGAIGIRKYRYAIIVGLLADLVGFFASIFFCKLLFL